ncbi:MAG: VCBS repeat-containing protein, partial [Chloroflexota bacterium]|nr:VCBS repeat-containing protein [Chloroflexota bacterium]
LAAESVNGRIWSLRGVRILPEGDLALAVSNRDGPSLLFDGFSPHLSESILPVDATPAGGVAWGDADGDGMLDLLLGAGSPPVVDSRIYYNLNGVITGASKPVLVPSGLGPQNVSFADVDVNGSLDIAIGGASESQIYLAGQTNRAWASPLPNARGHVVAWADADNNGTLDLLTAGYGGPVNLFLNGNGALGASPAFTTVLTGNVTSLAWCDIDKDGFPDFAVGNDGQLARVFHNNRDNTFSPIWDSGFTSHTTSIACADFNADSYPDLAIGSYQQGTVIFENSNGALSTKPIWSSPTLSKTTSIAWGDWNNDGYPELAIGNDGEPDQVFANLASSPGAPRLFWTWTSREMNATTGVAWGDYNGDGYLDLAISQNGSGQSGIYQNTTVRPAHLTSVFTPTMLLPNSPSYVWIQRPG